MTRLQRAELMRQSILDYLESHRGAPMRDVLAHLQQLQAEGEPQFEKITGKYLSQVLTNMRDTNEVAPAEGIAIASDGRPCAGWFARVSRTVAAADISARAAQNIKRCAAEKALKRDEMKAPDRTTSNTVWVGGSIKYRSGDDPAIQQFGARGQGALRQPLTINCQQDY
jgi:hypothetical protein